MGENGLNIIKIEGMAMSGLISSVEFVECGDKRAKIIAFDVEGNKLETECVERDAAWRNFGVIKLYLKWSKHITKTEK